VIDAVALLVGAKADLVALDRVLRVDFVGGRGAVSVLRPTAVLSVPSAAHA